MLSEPEMIDRKKSRKKGISGIIAGAIFFAILFTTGATYFSVVQQQNQLIQTTAIDRLELFRELRDEDLRVNVELDGSNFMISNVTNDGGLTVRIKEMFVVAPNGTMIKHLDSSPLPGTINIGRFLPINSTIKYDSGTWVLTVITERGSVATGEYPPPILPIAQQAIEAISAQITITAIGQTLINQSSLEFCYPETSDCTVESGWQTTWRVNEQEKTEIRIQLRNMGDRDYCLNNNTVIYGIGPDRIVAGGFEEVEASHFFIFGGMPTSNDENSDNPPAYSENQMRIENNASFVTIYFGADVQGSTTASEFDLDTDSGEEVIHIISLVLFAYAVDDGVSCSDAYTQGTPYAQAIPFQALIIKDCDGC